MAGKNKRPSITAVQMALYETLLPLIESMHTDIRELSRKSQNAVISKSRITMINRLLADAKKLLDAEPSAPYLQLLDEEALPQNADAFLVLGQFKAALDQFEEKYTYYDDEERTSCWSVSG
jgi:hypothetical protein